MFDKITIRASVSREECVHLARLHRLHVWVNEDGTKAEYRSGEYANITGVEVKIVCNKLTIKTSLHKYWQRNSFGKPRNDNLFTVSEAKAAFGSLLLNNGLVAWKVRIVQFELGLNMDVSYDPLSFIELVKYIRQSKGTQDERSKIMFVDANYRINRQKTSEKHRDIRKYYKIYDKGHEMRDRSRKQEYLEKDPEKILRIETVYKRHNERADLFFTDENINRLVKRFYVDWKDLFFFRDIHADKGTKKNEIESAKLIANLGAEEYLQEAKTDLENGKITPRQYRTIREFIRDFPDNSERFKIVISPQEKEYKRLIVKVFNEVK